MIDQQQAAYWQQNKKPRSPYHPISRFFSQQRWSFLERYIDLNRLRGVLDVGCGKGLGSLRFEETTIPHVGVDFSQAQLLANQLPALKKAQSTGESLPFPSRSFDLVMCWELLHHSSDPAQVVADMTRVSREWVVIFEPNTLNPGQFLFSALVWAERGSLRLRRSIIDGALTQNDYEILFFGKVGWVFPNRAPTWLFNILRRMPFRLPVFGISRLWIARRRGMNEPRGR